MRYATFSGNLGRDWSSKFVEGIGKEVYENTLAVSYKVKGEKQTMWVKLTQWNQKGGEALKEYTGKGSKLIVRGEVDVRAYASNDGTPKAELSVMVDGFEFVDSKKEETPETPKTKTPVELEDEIPFN